MDFSGDKSENQENWEIVFITKMNVKIIQSCTGFQACHKNVAMI